MPLEIVTLLAVLAMFAAEVRWLARCLWHRIPTIPVAAAAVSSALTKSCSWPRHNSARNFRSLLDELELSATITSFIILYNW
jgi:hypothetical protein